MNCVGKVIRQVDVAHVYEVGIVIRLAMDVAHADYYDQIHVLVSIFMCDSYRIG
jgi:hypothetical protein